MLNPFNFDFYLLSTVFYLHAKRTWVGPREIHVICLLCQSPKDWIILVGAPVSKEFSAVSSPRSQYHHAVEGRAPCLGPTPPQAEPHLPSKARGNPTCPQAFTDGQGRAPSWLCLNEAAGVEAKPGVASLMAGRWQLRSEDAWGLERG